MISQSGCYFGYFYVWPPERNVNAPLRLVPVLCGVLAHSISARHASINDIAEYQFDPTRKGQHINSTAL